MTLEDKLLRLEELTRQKRKIDAELTALLGGEAPRRGRRRQPAEGETQNEAGAQ